MSINDKPQPFLFGDYSLADVMFFSVVSRFNNYGITFSDDRQNVINTYIQAMLSQPAFKKWTDAALLEKDIIDEDER